MLKVVLNKDKEIVNKIKKGLKENNGFCPCSLIQTEDTKCMCKEFREQKTEGLCHCGLYKKINIK
jgi:ferredoxin-thioredoxin reductase catalytic subunit